MMFISMTKGVADALYRLICGFLWGHQWDGGKKVALVAWKYIIQPKEQGGLGFKDLIDKGTPFLANGY